MCNNDDMIHVLYLSRSASYKELDSQSTNDDTLVMGFFDNIEEIFKRNGRGGNTVDYLSAFGIHASATVAPQKLTAKQLFTLIESEPPLCCHYPKNIDLLSEQVIPDAPAPHFGEKLIPEEANPVTLDQPLEKLSIYPAFIGIIFISLNYFDTTNIEKIRENLQEFIKTARSKKDIPECAGEISPSAEIRFFKCSNCSDLCISVSTIRLMDILLVSKAIQICSGQKAKAQFSPVWSFVTILRRAFEEPKDFKNLQAEKQARREKTYFEQYISQVVRANSYRNEPQEKKKSPYTEKENITIDFRISFKSFEKEAEFLRLVPDAEKCEREIYQLSVDNIYRVAGVLGNGTYSVHLPFHDYLELFRFKYKKKHSLLNGQTNLENENPLLAFLLKEITGRDRLENDSYNQVTKTPDDNQNLENRNVEISYQRIRFCYPTHIFNGSELQGADGYSISRFGKAWENYKTNNEKHADNPPELFIDQKQIELLIQKMLSLITVYRNEMTSNEYRYREAVYLTKDLLYTYNDLLARNNIHTVIFVTQLFALLRDTVISCRMFVNAVGEQERIHLLNEVTENLRFACLALNRYNHEIVMNAGNNFNAQNYEIQSKVNIEKYVVAYSSVLQEICDNYRNQFAGNENIPVERLYPFVYLDIEQKRIHMYTLFRENRYRGSKVQGTFLLAVAIPNYRRFANIYRMLPQLVHEVSHRFIYTDDYTVENEYLIKKGTEYLGEKLANQFCELSEADKEHEVRNRLKGLFADALYKHCMDHVDNTLLAKTSKVMLKDNIINPYANHYCIIIPEFVNMLPLQKKTGKLRIPLGQMKTALDHLALSLGFSITFACETGCKENVNSYPELILQDLYEAISSAETNQTDQISKYICELADHYSEYFRTSLAYSHISSQAEVDRYVRNAKKEVLQGIQITISKSIDDKPVCREFIFSRQLLTNILQILLEEGMSHFGEICPQLYNEMDEELSNLISDFYTIGVCEDMKTLLDILSEKFKDKEQISEDLEKLKNQYQAYRRMILLLPDDSKIYFYVSQNEKESINQLLFQEIEKLMDYYAMRWKINKKNVARDSLLDEFSDASRTRARINLAIGYLGAEGITNYMYSYAKIHREICADLGMCGAFHFTPFGYLVYMSNLYIEHIENEDIRIEKMTRDQEVAYDFRNTRYLEVVKTLSDGKNPRLVFQTSQMLLQLHQELLKVLLPKMREYLASYGYSEEIEEVLCEIDGLCREEPELSETCCYSIDQNCYFLIILINLLGKKLRSILAAQKTEELQDIEHNKSQEELPGMINMLSDYLRYARVILKVTQFLIACPIMTDTEMEAPEIFYQDLYQNKILKADWTKHNPNARKDSFDCLRLKIGEFYNQCSEHFNSSYSFSEQIDFILYYYQNAHKRYHELYKLLTQGDKLKKALEGSEEEIWDYADEWLDKFFLQKK